MEGLPEILITVVKNHSLISFEFPDGNPIQLPKECLKSISEYFRTLCLNQIENQYIAINHYNYNQSCTLKHFLICICNGFKNILSELPIHDSLKILEFDSLLRMNPEIIQEITYHLAGFQYDVIKADYQNYWNYKYVKFSILEKVVKREKNIRIILDWLKEDSWEVSNFLLSQEFKDCQTLINEFPAVLPKDINELQVIISEFKICYVVIDLKKLINSLSSAKIFSEKYK